MNSSNVRSSRSRRSSDTCLTPGTREASSRTFADGICGPLKNTNNGRGLSKIRVQLIREILLSEATMPRCRQRCQETTMLVRWYTRFKNATVIRGSGRCCCAPRLAIRVAKRTSGSLRTPAEHCPGKPPQAATREPQVIFEVVLAAPQIIRWIHERAGIFAGLAAGGCAFSSLLFRGRRGCRRSFPAVSSTNARKRRFTAETGKPIAAPCYACMYFEVAQGRNHVRRGN